MENDKKNLLRRTADKVYGGLNMSWLAVILFAVATAAVTVVFLHFSIFQGTSFERMGVYFEAWIFFAVIIMANCKKPLEAAVKTFVFFLISQPLIYLFQVPFSDMGWGLFVYYPYWFFWTLLTFPMAFVGWYIKKKNWLSLLILAPILLYLTMTSVLSFIFTAKHFPYQSVTAVFCLLQVLLYIYTFTNSLWQRIVGVAVPAVIVAVYLMVTPALEFSCNIFLPDEPTLSDSAVAVCDDEHISVTLQPDGKESMLQIHADDYATTEFSVKDGDKEYRYSLRVYEDDGGHTQSEVERIG